jgi:hypothetical protein
MHYRTRETWLECPCCYADVLVTQTIERGAVLEIHERKCGDDPFAVVRCILNDAELLKKLNSGD